MRGPPGPLTLGKDPGVGSKVAGRRNILNLKVCFLGRADPLAAGGDAEVLFSSGSLQWRLASCPEKARTGRMKAPMRDALIVVLFIAMVLTPAVIAARSGRDLYRDE